MAAYEDPAAARRRLQRELRRLRNAAGLTQRDVAEAMDWSPSKVIRIEGGDVSITTNDLKQLLDHYGVKDPNEVDAYLATNKEGRKQSWADFKDVLTPQSRTYFGYEASALILRQFELSLIPGLLQTEEYTRALLADLNFPTVSGERIERLVESRKARQTLLDRDQIPELFYIIDESALRKEVGGKAVMLKQLDRLEELAQHERISIQVVPDSAGAYPGQQGPFTLIEFQDEDTALYLESLVETVTRDDAEEIGRYLDLFQDFERRLATRPDELGAMLTKIKKNMSGGRA